MKIQLQKRMAVLMSVLSAAVVIGVPVTGCGAEERADLTYPNKSYSYEEENAGPVDSWCPYEEEYLQKLKEEYDLDALVADCETEIPLRGIWRGYRRLPEFSGHSRTQHRLKD